MRACVTAGFELASRRLVLLCPVGLLTFVPRRCRGSCRSRSLTRLLALSLLLCLLACSLARARACVGARSLALAVCARLSGPLCWLAWWVRRDCWVCVGLSGSAPFERSVTKSFSSQCKLDTRQVVDQSVSTTQLHFSRHIERERDDELVLMEARKAGDILCSS